MTNNNYFGFGQEPQDEHIDVEFHESGFHDLNEFAHPEDDKSTEPLVKEVVKHQSKRPLMVVLISVMGAFLVTALFSVILYITASGSNDGASVLSGLGVVSGSVMSFVYLALSMFFSILGLLSLVGLLISIFKFLNTKNNNKEKKKNSLILFAISAVLFVLSISVVIFASANIESRDVEYVPEVIEDVQPAILTTPESTLGLVAPVEIKFEALNLGIDLEANEIVSYSWDFGDGATASGPSTVHTFRTKPDDGIFTVNLDVRYRSLDDATENIETLNLKKTVSIENIQTTALFTMTPDGGQAPLEVDFDASMSVDPDGSIVRYEWDFDGDTIIDADGVKTSHTYLENNDYDVTLFLTDNNGRVVETTQTLGVKGDEIFEVNLKNSPADEILAPGRSYTFDAARSKSLEGDIVKYEWNFGDGKTRVGQKVNYTFNQEGMFVVNLDLQDDKGNTTSFEKEYTVSKSPSGIFIDVKTTPEANRENMVVGEVPLKVDFDAAASSGGPIIDYAWDFENDGVIDFNGQDASFTYINSGEYKAKLTLTSVNGKQATRLINIMVEKAGLMTKVQAEPKIGEVPLTVDFDATSTKVPEGVDIVAFRWDFGDGTPVLREGPIVTHKFTSTGDFKVTVTAITDDNQTDTTETTVFVNEISLNACFKPSRTAGQAPLVVQFNPSCSTGNAQEFAWEFGNGQSSSERKPTFTFEEPGSYEVKLEVSDANNNVSEFIETITVE